MSRRWSRNGSILGRSPAKNTISGRSSPLKIGGTPYRINDLRVFRRTLIIAGVIFLSTVAFYVYQFGGSLSACHSRWGEFGDYTGGVLNPIFALFALVVLLRTVQLQTDELRLSNRELQHSSKALRDQSASLQLQNFERTFFEMVRLHHDIIKDLYLETTIRGRDCFRVLYDEELRRYYKPIKEPRPLEEIKDAYSRFNDNNQHYVGHYFRNFYRILKFVDESAMEVKDKKEYAGILRAQMSSYELLLMFYSTLHPIGENLMRLVERYQMFNNLEKNKLFNREDEDQFVPSAYEEQP